MECSSLIFSASGCSSFLPFSASAVTVELQGTGAWQRAASMDLA